MPMTNFFRAAVEGATCDGRVLERQHITEMAEQYDPRYMAPASIWSTF